jgi:hypothetical protein
VAGWTIAEFLKHRFKELLPARENHGCIYREESNMLATQSALPFLLGMSKRLYPGTASRISLPPIIAGELKRSRMDDTLKQRRQSSIKEATRSVVAAHSSGRQFRQKRLNMAVQITPVM